MKKLLLAIMLLCSISTIAQELEPLTFSEVVEVPNTTSKELHDRCLNWFAEAFIDSDEVLRSSSDDQLLAKPLIIYKPSMLSGSDWIKGTITYTVKVQFKENKYRYTISDFYHHGNPYAKYKTLDIGELLDTAECPYHYKATTKKWRNKVWADLHTNAREKAKFLIENLKDKMIVATSSTNDDW